MNKRGVGGLFCGIAAFLFATRYVTTALFLSGTQSWDGELFANGLSYIGSPLLIGSVCSLVVGVIYLIWGEIEDRRK